MAKMQATNPGQFNANGGNGQDMPFPRDMTE